jgi:hypothetical protein
MCSRPDLYFSKSIICINLIFTKLPNEDESSQGKCASIKYLDNPPKGIKDVPNVH